VKAENRALLSIKMPLSFILFTFEQSKLASNFVKTLIETFQSKMMIFHAPNFELIDFVLY
jgi:hypothetical protein